MLFWGRIHHVRIFSAPGLMHSNVFPRLLFLEVSVIQETEMQRYVRAWDTRAPDFRKGSTCWLWDRKECFFYDPTRIKFAHVLVPILLGCCRQYNVLGCCSVIFMALVVQGWGLGSAGLNVTEIKLLYWRAFTREISCKKKKNRQAY